MPLNPLQVSQAFVDQMPDPRQQTQNALQMAKLAESQRGAQNDNALRQALMSAGGLDPTSQAYLAAGGDAKGALALDDRAYSTKKRGWEEEDRRRTQRVSDADVAKAYHSMLKEGAADVDATTYKSFRSAVQKYAELVGEDTSDIPTEYDPKWVADAQARLKPAIEQIGGHEFLRQGNEYKQLTQEKADETWKTLTPDEAKRVGLPEGGAYERSSRGKTKAIVTPSKASGSDPQKVQMYNFVLKEGLAKNPNDAWRMANEAVANPTAIAAQMARKDFEEQQRMIKEEMQPEGFKPQTLGEMLTNWKGAIDQMIGGAGPAPAPDPNAPQDLSSFTDPSQVPNARQAPDGQWYVPNPAGGWMLLLR